MEHRDQMTQSYRDASWGAQALRAAKGAGLPTPPDEHPPPVHPMFRGSTREGTCTPKKSFQNDEEDMNSLEHQFENGALSQDEWKGSPRDMRGRRVGYECGQSGCSKTPIGGRAEMTHCLLQEGQGLAYRFKASEQEKAMHVGRVIDHTRRHASSIDEFEHERDLWKACVRELEIENQLLRHNMYMNALSATHTPNSSDTTTSDRPETRTLRQQLACIDERCQSLTSKMTKLQDQVAESHRLLVHERQERAEERNNQLTVVVAKHGLERRMRNREQDLQAEWRRNAELSQRCQRLEEDLAKAREAASNHANQHYTLAQDTPPHDQAPDPIAEDDWTDTTTSHLPPEFGYSKFVRWKKRTREGQHDHKASGGNGKKQKRASPGMGRLQLAGSESPPYHGPGPASTDEAPAGPGASAIDHMIAGEFTESEAPSRAVTPPALV